MTLEEWFEKQPRGAKTVMCKELGITLSWLGGILHRGACPSLELAKRISIYTGRKVRVKDIIDMEGV